MAVIMYLPYYLLTHLLGSILTCELHLTFYQKIVESLEVQT